IAGRAGQRAVDSAVDAVLREAAPERVGLGRIARHHDFWDRKTGAPEKRPPCDERSAGAIPERGVGRVDDRTSKAGEPCEQHAARATTARTSQRRVAATGRE